MRISFVIPAYNEEHYIASCLESIFREVQMGGYDAQIIVVNNASSDDTEDIVRRFPGVHLVREERRGTSFARMAGLLAADGDLFATIDADTEIPPGWIEVVLREFSENRGLIALSGPCIYVGVSKRRDVLIHIYFYLIYVAHIVGHHILRVNAVVLGGNFVARRDVLREIGGYNTDITFYGDDPDIAKRLTKAGRVKFSFDLKAHTSARRLNTEGLFRSAGRYVLNYFWILFFNRPLHREARTIRLQEKE